MNRGVLNDAFFPLFFFCFSVELLCGLSEIYWGLKMHCNLFLGWILGGYLSFLLKQYIKPVGTYFSVKCT